MDCLYSGQFINLLCISSLQTQQLFLVFIQDTMSEKCILGLIIHLGFQTLFINCHSSHALLLLEAHMWW